MSKSYPGTVRVIDTGGIISDDGVMQVSVLQLVRPSGKVTYRWAVIIEHGGHFIVVESEREYDRPNITVEALPVLQRLQKQYGLSASRWETIVNSPEGAAS